MNDILILHQNIRSLRKNNDVFIANINSYKHKPSFIFLSEIWINSDELGSYNLNGFNLFGACNDVYRAGGVCVYYDSGLCCQLSSLNLTSADIVKVEWSLNNEIYVILGIYRLQSTPKNIFLQEVSDLVRGIKSKNLFIVGDINIDILNFPTSCNDYMFLMSSFGLESLINVPTRVSSSSSTCIDHFFARTRSNVTSTLIASVFELNISDHCLIEISFKINTQIPSQTKSTFAHTKILNMALLNDILELFDWSPILNINDPSSALDKFLAAISAIFTRCQKPYKTNNIKLLQPWISVDLAKRINNRNRFYKKVIKHPYNNTLRDSYRNMCSQVNIDIKKEKEYYYTNKFSNNCGDVKKNWNLVNEILTKPAKSISIVSIMSDNGTRLTSDLDIANDFICYFTNVAKCMRDKFFSTRQTLTNQIPSDYCPVTFFMSPVSNNEILSIIDSLESKHSLDNDGLSNNLLKAISKYICCVLTHIFNLSFEKGIVPMRLKSATIIPLFKKGERSDKGNYRPIALQPVILKVLEKLVKNRVTIFLDQFNILSSHQHGFRSFMSTETAMLEFLNFINTKLNHGKVCAGLFVDAVKAFDMVDHQLLLSILYDIGFRGVSNKWFASYLADRTVRVKINNTLSDPKTVVIGVPQGSVLGPLLFLVYTNSIFKLKLHGNVTGFADDLALAYSSNSMTDIFSMLNLDLKSLHSWFYKHYLVLSEKTKLMLFKIQGIPIVPPNIRVTYHSSFHCRPNNCHTDCFDIEVVNSFKYLGIHLDSNLDWKIHVANVKRYLLSASRIFFLLRNVCPISVLKIIYHALVMAKLQYGLSSWGSCGISTLKPIYTQQKMILRTILRKNRFEPSWPLFKINHILPLQHLYVYKVLKIFFKRSGQQNMRVVAHYNLRMNHQNYFVIPKFNNDHYRRSISVAAPTFFNALPDTIRSQIYSKSFLNKVKVWLFETCDVTGDFLRA